jgi:hypothetical protein
MLRILIQQCTTNEKAILNEHFRVTRDAKPAENKNDEKERMRSRLQKK